MKLFRLFAAAALSLAVMSGCGDKSDETVPFELKFDIDDAKVIDGRLEIGDRSYNNYIILAANTNSWEVEYTPASSWLTVTRIAEGESNRVKIEAAENGGFDARTATVAFRYEGRQVGAFEVRQHGSAEILEIAENSRVHTLMADGGEFEIQLSANRAFAVSYEPEGISEWVAQIVEDGGDGEEEVKTRTVSLVAHTLKFSASANEDIESRVGKIIFTLGEIVREATVNQFGNVPDILVSEEPVELEYDATLLEISVASNVAYSVDVEYADGEGWLDPVLRGRAMVSEQVEYTVTPNGMAESRSAKVVFTYTEKGMDIRREVPVTQKGHLVLGVMETIPAISGGSIPLAFAASTFTVKIASNSVVVPETVIPDWITRQGEAVHEDGAYIYTFGFGDNNGYTERTGSISFGVYGESLSVWVSQAVGIIYEDQIRVIGAVVTQNSAPRGGAETMFNGVLIDNYDSNYNVTSWEDVTLTFELEAGAKSLSHIVYYKKGSSEGNAHSMTQFELLASDTANGTFVSHGTYDVAAAEFGLPRKIILRESIPNPKFIRMKITASTGLWFTCAEMQFFSMTVQNDEYFSHTLTPSGDNGGFAFNPVPHTGSASGMPLSILSNIDYVFEKDGWITITEAPGTRALPERSTKEWLVSADVNTSSLWRRGTVTVKKPDGTVLAAIQIPQAANPSGIAVAANSNSSDSIEKAFDYAYSSIWESKWGSGGDGILFDLTNPISASNPAMVSCVMTYSPSSVSGFTLVPREGNGDWVDFTVTVKTPTDTAGSVVYTHIGQRVNSVLNLTFEEPVTDPAEVIFTITGTSNTTTASMREIILWE